MAVEFCNWCKDPSHPDPAFHPNGQAEHRQPNQRLEEILAEVRKKSPQERANFAQAVGRYLEELPMRCLLKDVNQRLSTGDWMKLRSWIMGIEGAEKPEFVIEKTELGGKEGLEKVRVAIRRVIEVNPFF